MVSWSDTDEQRIADLRRASRKRDLTDDERAELRALRQREIAEATRRRIAFFKRR
jgi:uncharacterized protein YnzC (UPF0291/DUF896 family)